MKGTLGNPEWFFCGITELKKKTFCCRPISFTNCKTLISCKAYITAPVDGMKLVDMLYDCNVP